MVAEPPGPSLPDQRFATALFVDLVGSTSLAEQLPGHESYAIVTDVLKLLDAAAVHHGGTIEQYQGDGMLCVFGATAALENAAGAALNAAIEMRRRLQRYNEERKISVPLRVRIGVNSGHLLRGDPLRPNVQNLRVFGDVVNTAARLQQAASPGQIFAGLETQRLTRDEFDFRDLGPLPAKGKAEGVRAFELLTESSRPGDRKVRSVPRLHSELVGRAGELARLERAVSRVAAGVGGVFALVGEAGLGKSRLVRELRTGPAARGVRWLEARSTALSRTLRFHPFVDLIERAVGVDHGDDEATAARKLESAIAGFSTSDAPEVAALISRVMGQQSTGASPDRLQQVQADAMQGVVTRTARRLLDAAAERGPLVIEFEDAHWADGSSVLLLQALFSLALERPVLFLLVCRPHVADTSEMLRSGARQKLGARYEELVLEPLDAGAAGELLRNLLRTENVPPDVARGVGVKAAGNPFFLEQLVSALLDQGVLVETPDGFVSTERIQEISVPGTIEEVVSVRIDLLSPEHRNVIQIASVIGRPFPIEVIAEILPEKDRLASGLAHLCAVQLLERRQRPGGEEYGFRHPVLQEVIYGAIFPTKREEIHRDVARAIELHLTRSVPGYEGMLAWHYSMGREESRAEDHLLAAGEEAARLGASNEALVLFRQAADLYFRRHGQEGDSDRSIQILRNVARAHANHGQFLEAVEHLNRALWLLGERPVRGRLDAAGRTVLTAASVLARLYLPQRGSRRPATDQERTIIALMFDRARAQTTTAPTRFIFDSMDTLRRLWRVDAFSVPQAGGMYAGSVGIFSYGGLSFGLSRRLLAVARPLVHTEDIREHFLFRFMSFLHHYLAGDWSEAHLIEEELVARALSIGQLWDVVNYLNLFAERATHRGERAAAERAMQRLAEIEHDYEYELARSALRARRIHAALLRGDLEEALTCVDVYLSAHEEEQLQVLGFGERAMVLLLAGRRDAAARALARGQEILRRRPLMPPFHRVRLLRAQLAYDLELLEAAGASRGNQRRRLVSATWRSARAAQRAAIRVAAWRTDVLRMVGSLAWLTGRRRRARQLWSEALEDAQRRGARLDLAVLHGEIARRLAQAGAHTARVHGLGAEQHAQRARDLWLEIGPSSERRATLEPKEPTLNSESTSPS